MGKENIPNYKEDNELSSSAAYQRAKSIAYENLPSSVLNKIRRVIHPGVDFGSKPASVECAGLRAEIFVNNWSDYYVVHGDHCEGEILERVVGSLREKDGNGVFMDIGAAQGIYSVFAGQLAEIICVEPNVYNIPSLFANLARNNINANKSEILSTAIGDKEGRGTMYFDPHNLLDTSLKKTKYNLRSEQTVSISTIDRLIEDGYPIPTDIKMDVEGAEGLVLKGASNLLKSEFKPRDLFIEFHPDFLPLFGTTYEAEFSRVINSGYVLAGHVHRHGQVLCHFTTK